MGAGLDDASVVQEQDAVCGAGLCGLVGDEEEGGVGGGGEVVGGGEDEETGVGA